MTDVQLPDNKHHPPPPPPSNGGNPQLLRRLSHILDSTSFIPRFRNKALQYCILSTKGRPPRRARQRLDYATSTNLPYLRSLSFLFICKRSRRLITATMGLSYNTYLNSNKIYGCKSCKAHLANHDDIISRVSSLWEELGEEEAQPRRSYAASLIELVIPAMVGWRNANDRNNRTSEANMVRPTCSTRWLISLRANPANER